MIYYVARLKLNTNDLFRVYEMIELEFDTNVIDFDESGIEFSTTFDGFLMPKVEVQSISWITFKPETNLKLVCDNDKQWYLEYIIATVEDDDWSDIEIDMAKYLEGVKLFAKFRMSTYECRHEIIKNVLYNDFDNEYIISNVKEC